MTVQAQSLQTESRQEYTLQILAHEPLVAHVSANIFIKDGHLFTGEGGADQFPRHWAVFVKNLQVRDGLEHLLPISEVTNKDSEKGEWSVGDAYSGPAQITYDVDLGFTKTKWDPSNEKAGYFDGKALYLVTKMLFLASVTDKPAELRIVVPSGYKVATPWNALEAGDEHTFVAPTTFDLQQNSIVVGDFGAHEVRQGNFPFTVALLGKLKESGAIAASTMAVFARHYAQMFPSTLPLVICSLREWGIFRAQRRLRDGSATHPRKSDSLRKYSRS